MNETEIQELRAKFRGELITPGDAAYDAARKVYNGMIDRRPALIARCADVADVMAGVTFAREKELLLAVRGGGHNGPGLGVCDGGLVIDLSRLKGIRVDQENRTVRVEGGCLWGDVDHATHPFGLAVPSGFISTTGVGGLTLGGGIGYLSRKYGLTIDNLLARRRGPRGRPPGHGQRRGEPGSLLGRARRRRQLRGRDLVPLPRQPGRHRLRRADLLADGQGSGAAALLARLHPEGPGGHQRLVRLRDRAPGSDVPGRAPPEEDVRGHVVLHGRHREGGRGLQAHPRSSRRRSWTSAGPIPFPVLQSLFDGLYPAGLQWYWKADFFQELSDKAIDLHVKYGERLPSPHSTMHLYPINGAAQRAGQGRHGLQLPRRELRGGHRGSRSRPGEQPPPRCSGPRTTGSPCTPSRRAAATST